MTFKINFLNFLDQVLKEGIDKNDLEDLFVKVNSQNNLEHLIDEVY